MDLHAHVAESASIDKVLASASKKVDVLALVGRQGEDNKGHLDLEGAVKKLEELRIDHYQFGKRVVCANWEDEHWQEHRLYLVQGLELYTKENQGMIIVGNSEVRQDQLPMVRARSWAENMGSFWFLDHPFSVAAPKIGFRYPNNKELQERKEWFYRYKPVVEIGNHQNTLWMYPSNIAAKRWAEKYGLVGIANSDSHFCMADYGRSRTSVPNALIDGSSEDNFIASLRRAFSKENKDQIQAETGYSSLASFTRHMMIPTIKKGLGF